MLYDLLFVIGLGFLLAAFFMTNLLFGIAMTGLSLMAIAVTMADHDEPETKMEEDKT